MLNLGCGGDYLGGWVNVDSSSLVKADVRADLNHYPWCWRDGSVNRVLMSHSLEHLSDPKLALLEVQRVLRPGGLLILRLPHFSRGLSHPFHKSSWGYGLMNHLREEVPGFSFEVYEPLKFRYSRMPNVFLQAAGVPLGFLANLHQGLCERVWAGWVGGFEELTITLRKVRL